MDSQEFHQECCEAGFAQVDVKILLPFELYQERLENEDMGDESDAWFHAN
jgi:hypothetical protein